MKKILTLITLLVFAAAIIYAGGEKEGSEDTMMKMEPMDDAGSGNAMKADHADDSMKDDNAMMAKDDSMMKAPFNLNGLGNQIVAFESEKKAQELAKDNTVIYFFAASWCPSCQATYRSLQSDFKSIPDDTYIIVVNYDEAGALKSKYSVTYQHTFVVIDGMGMKESVWSGSESVKAILSKSMADSAM